MSKIVTFRVAAGALPKKIDEMVCQKAEELKMKEVERSPFTLYEMDKNKYFEFWVKFKKKRKKNHKKDL